MTHKREVGICRELHGWEVKEYTPDLGQRLEQCSTYAERHALIAQLENMVDAQAGKDVLVMSLTGWARGVVVAESGSLPFKHVDSGGCVFPIEMADDERRCWVTTCQVNKKVFNPEPKES